MSDQNLEQEDRSLIVTSDDVTKFRRLDHFFQDKLPDISRSLMKNLFQEGHVWAENNQKIELKKMPPAGTIITVNIPPPIDSDAKAEDIPLKILYEDEYLLIIEKDAGMVIHPAPGHYTGTLVNALLYHVKDLKGIGNVKRPGIVHRLDMGTTGVMVVAKDQKTHELLTIMFAKHDLTRKYLAIAMGKTSTTAGTLNAPLGRHPIHRQKISVQTNGRHAITHYKIKEQFSKCFLVELQLETGRTHQIRVHLATLLKTAILNDATYGNPKEHHQRVGDDIAAIIGEYPYPFLHAYHLSFVHPITQKQISFETPLPEPFSSVLSKLREHANA